MRRQFLITFLEIIFAFALNAQDSLVIKLALNDCHNCYAGFCTVEKLPSDNSTTLILKEEDRQVGKKFISSKLGLTRAYTVIYSDSLFQSLSHIPMSEVFLFESKELIYTSSLESFSISKLFITDTLFTLPDSLSLSRALRLEVSENYLTIQDAIFNEIYLFALNEKKLVKSFNKQSYPVDSIYKWVNLDTIAVKLFSKARSLLRTSQNDITFSEGSFFMDNSIVIHGSYPYMKKTKGDTVMLLRKCILFTHPLSDPEKFSYCQIDSFMEGPIQFFPSSRNIFPYSKNKILVRSTSSNKDYSYMLNIWNIENNKPVQTQILENQIPDFYTKTNLKFNFLQEIFAWPYLLYSLSNVVTNLETGECHQLPFRNEDFIFSFDKMDQIKFNFQIVDACFSDNKLSILYFDHEKYMRIVEIDTKTFSIKRTLTFPERIMKGNPVLSYWKKECLVGLTRDGKVIKIILSL